MAKFIVRRIFLLFPTMILVSMAAFLTTKASPIKNAAKNALGSFITPGQETSFRAGMDLDRSVRTCYIYRLLGK